MVLCEPLESKSVSYFSFGESWRDMSVCSLLHSVLREKHRRACFKIISYDAVRTISSRNYCLEFTEYQTDCKIDA